jgi:gliding motility-associated-like protein
MVTDQHSCKGTATVSVVKSTPSVSLSSPDYTICPGECSQITALGTSSFPPFTYSWSNSPIYVRDSTFACVAGTVSVVFTDNKGCFATKTATVVNDVIPSASFVASSTPPFTPGQPINFVSTSTIPSGTITSYVWLFGDGNGANGNSVNHAYINSGTYPITLVVTGSNGCLDTVVVNYMVDAIIELPNVFTPNGDNVNDHLKFRNLEAFSKNTLTIFNRWGKKVFQQDNYKNDWNGTGMSDGTYFFILEIPEATPSSYKGYIELMR